MSQLVSSGDSIKIWDTTSYDCIHDWSSSNNISGDVFANYSSNSWSCDNGCVASSVKGKNKIVLTYTSKSSKYTSQEIQLQAVSKPTVVEFPRTTQKSLIVSSESSIHQYDLSRQKVSKSFSLKSRVNAVAVNYCDAYIAAGCVDGAIQLVTVATNQVSAPMVTPKCVGHKITSVKYNTVKPSFLGASSESGILSFWDCNTNKFLFSLTPHIAPASAITFSPINDSLALSVGLDKKLVCCDTKTKKTIMTIQCEDPLTSADFDHDGVNLAVGSSRGRVLIYDLRSPKSPVHNIAAHNSCVTSVAFKHKQATQTSSANTSSTTKSRSRLTSQKSAPSLKTVMEEGKENNDPGKNEVADEIFDKADEKIFTMDKKDDSILPTNRRESISSMLFSPLRDSDTSLTSHVSTSISRDIDSRLGLDRRNSETRRLSNDSVFSPLRDSPGPGSTNVSLNRRTPFTSFNTPPTMSPLAIIREETNPTKNVLQTTINNTSNNTVEAAANINISKPNVTAPAQEKLSLENISSFVKETINVGSKSPEFQPQVTRPEVVETQPDHVQSFDNNRSSHSVTSRDHSVTSRTSRDHSVTSRTSSNDSSHSQPSEFQNLLVAFPQISQGGGFHNNSSINQLNSAVDKISDKLTSSNSPLMNQNQNLPESYQKEYISNVVNEAMQEWCYGVDKRLWGFHYNLLRQLQTHQEETKMILTELTGMATLKEEIDRLKQENNELKKFFGTNQFS